MLKFWLCMMAIVGLILAVGSATLVHTYPAMHAGLVTVLELLERLGDALVIAAIVGGVIEKIVFKKETIEQARNLFIWYFGRLLPPELQNRLRGYLEMSLVRTRWDITYTIEHWNGNPDYLRLETVSEYDMQNHSDQKQDYQYRYEVEDSLCTELAQTLITFVKVDRETYESDDLRSLVKPERGYQVFRHPRPVEMEPHSRATHPTYSFSAKSIECFKRTIVSPFWALYPVITTRFTIWHPEDVDVLFDVTIGDVGEVTTEDPLTEGSKKGTRWTINQPILPGQGFHVRCNLKPPDRIQAVPASAPNR